MAADEFNQNPLIPTVPVKLTCILAGFMSDDFSAKVKAYLDTEEINAYFNAATKEVTVGFGPLNAGRHNLSIRTIGHPGFWGATSYDFEVVDEPPDFTVGWEDEYHLIVEFAKPMPHWEMESPNAYGMTGVTNSISKFDGFISNRIFRLTLDSPLTHPKNIDAASLPEDIKVTFNSVLGYKEGILMKAKNKSGAYMPRAGQDHGECDPTDPVIYDFNLDKIEWEHFNSQEGEVRAVGNYDTDITVCGLQIDVPFDACNIGTNYQVNWDSAATLNPYTSFDIDADTLDRAYDPHYYNEYNSSDWGICFKTWPRNTLFVPRLTLMMNCGNCGWYDIWLEDRVWFGDMHVDWTPPVEADICGSPFEFVMGSELTTHVEGLLDELNNYGNVYTLEGQTGDLNFLMSYYDYMVGQYAEDNIVYGVLVAMDGEQESDHDPGGFLHNQMALDMVDCNDNLICTDYFVENMFYVDRYPLAAYEYHNESGSYHEWPTLGCGEFPSDGYASGEYSVWILGIPLEYYATYKKMKVRIKDDVDNWSRFDVYDLDDTETELWIDPPPDNADYSRCETVVFQANIEPEALGGLLPFIEWIPVDGEGDPRDPASQDPENGYNSIILSGDPPWFGDEFIICIRDTDFWVKASVMGCGEEYSDIKHVTDPLGISVTYDHPADGTYRKYNWDDDFEVGEGWGDGSMVFKQYVNYPDGQDFEGSEIVIDYSVTPFDADPEDEMEVWIIYHKLLDPPTDIYGNVVPTNPVIYSTQYDINDNSDFDMAYLTINGSEEDLPYPYLYAILEPPGVIPEGPDNVLDLPEPPELVLHNISPYGGDNYQILIEVKIIAGDELCESRTVASPVINVWRKGYIYEYAMDNWDDENDEYYDPDYPKESFAPNTENIIGAFDDGFFELSFVLVESPLTYYQNEIEFAYEDLLLYCDKEDEQDEAFVPFHDPWYEHNTPTFCIHLQGIDRFDDLGQYGLTWLDENAPDKGACIHRHSLVSIYDIYLLAQNDQRYDFDYYSATTTTHEIGHNLNLLNHCAPGTCVMALYCGDPFPELDYLCAYCIYDIRRYEHPFLDSVCY